MNWIVLACFLPFGKLYAIKCFYCQGIFCEPSDDLKIKCKSIYTEHCYILSKYGLTYRGCYESEDKLAANCSEYRMSHCHVCKGELCNSTPTYQDTEMFCWQCAKGECSRENSALGIHVNCLKSLSQELPQCYSYFSYADKEFTFDCLANAPIKVRRICEEDHFQAACRICSMPGCNERAFFHVKNTLKCHDSLNKVVECEYDPSFPHYYTCVQSDRARGCLGTLLARQSMEFRGLSAGHFSMVGCSEIDHLCNNRPRNMRSASPRKTQDCGNYFCGAERFTCSSIRYVDEHHNSIKREECQNKYPCWRKDICLTNYQQYDLQVTKRQCYLCSRCPLVFSPKTDQWISSKILNDAAIIYWDTNNIQRDCGAGLNSSKRVAFVKDWGNNWNFTYYCFICNSLENPRCGYDQFESVARMCPHNVNSIWDSYTGCYTEFQPLDGLTVRDCYKTDTFKCPVGHECSICYTHMCNGRSLITNKCLVCEGKRGSDCATNVKYLSTEVKVTDCPDYFLDGSCYMAEHGNLIKRGCTKDTYHRERDIALKEWKLDNITYYFCGTPICNYFTYHIRKPNSTTRLGSQDWVFLLSGLIFIRYEGT